MTPQDMKQLINEAVRDSDLYPNDIPSIDLYMDQITSLVADKAKEGSERHRDRVLTKTMINNYSKDGLISPIKGKKYDKEQILQMLLVYSMKNTLSIGEIKRVLQNVYALQDYDEAMLEEVYARFLHIKELQRKEASDSLLSVARQWELDLERDADFFTFLLSLSAWSSYLKNAVQALLEERYLDEEQLKKELAKQQRLEEKAQKMEEKTAKKEEKSAKKEEKAKKKEEAKSKKEDAPEGEAAP